MIYHVSIGERSWTVEIGTGGISVDGREVEVDFTAIDDSPIASLLVEGVSHRLVAHRAAKERWDLHLGGRRMRAHVVDERTRVVREMSAAKAGPIGPRPITAPMPGMVVRFEVVEGDFVRAGQGVVIVEAMKMENELTAKADGVVTRVHVAAGEAVEKDQLLVDFAAPEEEQIAVAEPGVSRKGGAA